MGFANVRIDRSTCRSGRAGRKRGNHRARSRRSWSSRRSATAPRPARKASSARSSASTASTDLEPRRTRQCAARSSLSTTACPHQDGSGYGQFGGPRRQGPTIASQQGRARHRHPFDRHRPSSQPAYRRHELRRRRRSRSRRARSRPRCRAAARILKRGKPVTMRLTLVCRPFQGTSGQCHRRSARAAIPRAADPGWRPSRQLGPRHRRDRRRERRRHRHRGRQAHHGRGPAAPHHSRRLVRSGGSRPVRWPSQREDPIHLGAATRQCEGVIRRAKRRGQWAEAWEPRSGSALAETERLSASERPSKVRNRRTGPRGWWPGPKGKRVGSPDSSTGDGDINSRRTKGRSRPGRNSPSGNRVSPTRPAARRKPDRKEG